MTRFGKWLQNYMIRTLRSRGFVVFYLDEQSRFCRKDCWLEIYKSEQKMNGEQNG